MEHNFNLWLSSCIFADQRGNMDNSEQMSDEGLMGRLTAGDALALEGLYKRHRQRVYSVALQIIGDPQAAEEVLQDAFF